MVKYIPRSSITIACALMLAGCAAVGPDFHRPASEGVVPGAFARDRLEASEAPTLLATTDVRDTVFWSGFGDEQLTQLVQHQEAVFFIAHHQRCGHADLCVGQAT